jgi:hypothetical protein
MAYPALLVLGLAASAAGTGMSMAAAEQSRTAMRRTREAEMARQRGYQRDAEQVFADNLRQSDRDTADETLDNAAERRAAEYAQTALPAEALPARPGGEPGGDVTAGNPEARARAATEAIGNAWRRLNDTARARLGAQDDWQLDTALGNADAQNRLAVTANLSRGSGSVLAHEMQDAQHAGDKLAGWGSLVSALGSTAGTAGAMGYGPTWGTPPPATGASVAPAVNSMNTTPVNLTPQQQLQYNAWRALNAN